MKSNSQALRMTVLYLMAAIELIFSFTPLGTFKMGPIEITMNVIPIAFSAVILGPVGGGALGAFFGFLSYLQCFGVGVSSEMGAQLVAESSGKTAVLCIVPRLLAGVIAGSVHYLMKNKFKMKGFLSGAATGLCTALSNTVLFMTVLMLLLGDTELITNIRHGQNVILFIFAFVGVNAIVEMLVSTILTSAAEFGLDKSRILNN